MGHESDSETKPRILLYGSGPYPFTTAYSLQYDCLTDADGQLTDVLYVGEYNEIVPTLPTIGFPTTPVQYWLDGVAGRERRWEYVRDSEGYEFTIAPKGIKDDIVDAMLRGVREVKVTAGYGGDYPTEMSFMVTGFRQASEPVRRTCR